MALFEDKGKVGRGFLTASFCFGHLWLNNEGPIDLKGRNREKLKATGWMNVPEGTKKCDLMCFFCFEKPYCPVMWH